MAVNKRFEGNVKYKTLKTSFELKFKIEYSTKKNRINLKKHHISIPELSTIFTNPFIEPILDVPDPKHSSFEPRYHAYGWTSSGFYVKVWYCYRGENTIRIIGGMKVK